VHPSQTTNQLASLMSTVLLPSVICGDPGPLANAAWMMGKAMTRIADLADPDESLSRHSCAENAEDLAGSLSCALGRAHGCWASIRAGPGLAARALDSAVSRCDSEGVAGQVTMTLDLPDATGLTVTLDQVSYAKPGGGFTTVAADSPLGAGIGCEDHLEIRSALNMTGAVLTRHLAEDAFGDWPHS
jgi:hypothetical protein